MAVLPNERTAKENQMSDYDMTRSVSGTSGGNIGGLKGYGQDVTKTALPAVHVAIERQDKCIAELFNVTDELAARLSPVLAPAPTGNDAQKAQQGPSVASRIELNGEAIARIAGRVRDLISRLEV
jgi:hypothetical protein